MYDFFLIKRNCYLQNNRLADQILLALKKYLKF
jgi:hypothetical protein